MKKSPKFVVYYVRDGNRRVRIFVSEERMDRWIRKFKRDISGDDESWLDLTINDVFGNIKKHNSNIYIVPEGE